MKAAKIGRFLKDVFRYVTGEREAPYIRARRMIDVQGVNPFFAWREVHGMDCPALAARMKDAVADHATPLPAGIVWPSDGDVVQQFCGSPRALDEYPSAGFVLAFCAVFAIEPQLLERIVRNGEAKPEPVPAPAALIEAAVAMARERKGEGTLNRIFLGLELHKAALLGMQRGAATMQTNAEMLEAAERDFEQAAAKSPDMIAEDMYEETSPVEDIRAMQDAVFSHYTTTLQRRADANVRMKAALQKRRDVAQKSMQSCILAMCETGRQAQWVKVFRKILNERGFEGVFACLQQSPEDVFPMRRSWRSSASLRLPDKRFVVGVGVADAMIENMRAYTRCSQDMVVQENARGAHQLQRDLFREWRKLPATETYLRAVANARHIEGEAGDILAGLRDEVKNGGFPSLLPPPSPAP